MYSGRAGLAALPLGMGQTVKNFRSKLLMKCVKVVLVLWWRGWDRGTIIFVVCLLLSPLPVLQFFVLHLAPAQGNLTVTDTLHCTALSNTSYVTW